MAARKSSASNIKIPDVDALFGLEPDGNSTAERVEEIAIGELYPFPSHPIHSKYWMMKKCRKLWKVLGSMESYVP